MRGDAASMLCQRFLRGYAFALTALPDLTCVRLASCVRLAPHVHVAAQAVHGWLHGAQQVRVYVRPSPRGSHSPASRYSKPVCYCPLPLLPPACRAVRPFNCEYSVVQPVPACEQVRLRLSVCCLCLFILSLQPAPSGLDAEPVCHRLASTAAVSFRYRMRCAFTSPVAPDADGGRFQYAHRRDDEWAVWSGLFECAEGAWRTGPSHQRAQRELHGGCTHVEGASSSHQVRIAG